MERVKPSGELNKEWGSRRPFPFPFFCFSPCHLPFSTPKSPQAFNCKFMASNHCSWARRKGACRIYMIILSLHKSRFCLTVSEVKFKERFRHQNLRNVLNGYKWFPMATKYFLVHKQYLVTYVRYICTRWQSASSTSCKELQRQYLVVFCENRPHPNPLETWKYNRLITTNKTSR